MWWRMISFASADKGDYPVKRRRIMDKKTASLLIDAALGRIECDTVIRNAKVVDVFSRNTFDSDVYVINGLIAGFGGKARAGKEIDAGGMYLIPGFIDAHCHIESSHLSPSEFSDAVIPRGTTTVIADPHEICNVTGLDGMEYMLRASENIPLSVFLMFPSCVPATPFEHSGAILNAEEIRKYIDHPRVLGLGEMMNYPGVASHDETVMDKLEEAYSRKKNIDGHIPSITGDGLDAYTAAGITTDHECETPEELREKVRKGMYIMLRQGTACRNVLQLLPGVDERNSSRILFCTDDKQPQTIVSCGHVNEGVNIAIQNGLDPITAISAATLNASICYGLSDRGAIAPGRRADFFLASSIDKGVIPEKVFILGRMEAEKGKILRKAPHTEPEKVAGRMDVRDFSEKKLSLKPGSDHVKVIDIIPGGVVTGSGEAYIRRDGNGEWVHEDDKDILKLAVIERHHGTGNAATALIRGYGMKHGAIATSIAHDSHNIIAIGDNDADMAAAVRKLIEIGGGITMFRDGHELGTHRLEIAGLMTDLTLEEVTECLDEMHKAAYEDLHVSKDIDPFMTLCFMALPVIPSLKLTDCGLFDVDAFAFTEMALKD